MVGVRSSRTRNRTNVRFSWGSGNGRPSGQPSTHARHARLAQGPGDELVRRSPFLIGVRAPAGAHVFVEDLDGESRLGQTLAACPAMLPGRLLECSLLESRVSNGAQGSTAVGESAAGIARDSQAGFGVHDGVERVAQG